MTMQQQVEGLFLEIEARAKHMIRDAEQLLDREVVILTGTFTGRRGRLKSAVVDVRGEDSVNIWYFVEIPKANGDEGVVWAHPDARRSYRPDELELV